MSGLIVYLLHMRSNFLNSTEMLKGDKMRQHGSPCSREGTECISPQMRAVKCCENLCAPSSCFFLK